jgi:hypothetical protein
MKREPLKKIKPMGEITCLVVQGTAKFAGQNRRDISYVQWVYPDFYEGTPAT